MAEIKAPGDARVQSCKSCKKPIFFANMPSGAPCPFDAEPVLDGEYQVNHIESGHIGVIVKMHKADGRMANRYRSHYMTCNDQKRFSKKAAAK